MKRRTCGGGNVGLMGVVVEYQEDKEGFHGADVSSLLCSSSS